jgi:hypothetical protein
MPIASSYCNLNMNITEYSTDRMEKILSLLTYTYNYKQILLINVYVWKMDLATFF